jgi:hypothetical protein
MGWHGPETATDEELARFTMGKMLKRGRAWLLNEIAAPLATGDPEEIVLQAIEEGFKNVGDIGEPDFRIKAFKTWNWSFRWTTNSLRAYLPAAFPRLPFYEPEVVRFFEGVSTAHVCGRKLQVEWIKRYAPDLARVTWQPYDTNLYRIAWHRTWLLPKRALKKVARSLRGRPVPVRNWEVQLLHDRGRLEERLLDAGSPLHGFVARQRIAELITRFFAAPDAATGYTVSMLLSLGLWLEDGRNRTGSS